MDNKTHDIWNDDDGAEERPRKKRHRLRRFLLFFLALVVVLAVVLFNVFSSLGGGSGVYLYATDDYELMFLDGLKEDSETNELSDEVSGGVYFSPDGKYIYFFEQAPEDYEEYCDLYRIACSQAGKEGERPERVSSKVFRYQFTLLDNGGAVYLKESGSSADLYCYDGESDFKLADEVYSFTVDSGEDYAYYTQMDEDDGTRRLSRIALKEDGREEEILEGADIIYSALDAEILLYGEAKSSGSEWSDAGIYDVYSVKPGEREELVAEEACSVRNVDTEGGKLSFTYMTQETETHTLYDFVSDSTAAADAAVQEPLQDDFITGYSEWGWAEYDWDAYYAAWDAWYAVSSRVSMREQLKENKYDLVTYTLHRYSEGTDTTVSAGLSDYPVSLAEKNIYLYGKTDQEVSQVVDLSELSYYSEIYNYIGTAEQTMYQNVNGVESELDLEDWTGVDGIFSAGDNQLVLLLRDEDGQALVACGVENDALVLGDVLEDEDFSVRYSGQEDTLYYFADIDSDGSSGSLTSYTGGEAAVVAKDAWCVMLLEDGTAFKLEDWESGLGSLYVVNDGKDERIDDDVSAVEILSPDRVLYISDNDLYLWEKGESVRLARDVIGVWASSAAPYDGFYC